MQVAAKAIVHLDGNRPSIEGLICKRRGRMVVAGHYVLRDAKILQGDGPDITTVKVDGEVHVPVDRVVFVEVLTR